MQELGKFSPNTTVGIGCLASQSISDYIKMDSLERLDPSVAEECDLVVPAGDGPVPVGRRALLRLLVDEQVLPHAEPL